MKREVKRRKWYYGAETLFASVVNKSRAKSTENSTFLGRNHGGSRIDIPNRQRDRNYGPIDLNCTLEANVDYYIGFSFAANSPTAATRISIVLVNCPSRSPITREIRAKH